MSDHRSEFPLHKMCRVLEVTRSGYYAFQKRAKSQQRVDNETLLIDIKRIFLTHKENYGSPRIWNELNRVERISCSENRVARLMRIEGLVAVQKKKFRLTTDSKHGNPVWPNILNRKFHVEKPNEVWVSDITYVWTLEGWLYLAVILDLFSRGIVGLAMDKTIADTLIIQAMNQAITQRRPEEGLIFHSDRGSQYTSNDFKSILTKRNLWEA